MSSSVVDEDTARAVNNARSSVRAMLSTAQTHLQKAFLVFVAGLLGTVWALRAFIWDELKAITTGEMTDELAAQVDIIAVTPFDVILLQVKIGLFVGVFAAIPVVLYYSRDALRKRGVLPETPVARWKLAVMGVLSAILFVVGVLYGYYVFFPFMFNFLAANAVAMEIEPTYSIVDWTQFIVLLTASFGFAAQLPLVMSVCSYTEIVPYETFRDKWRYAILGIFVFGAFFSPPDPFTQLMWAAPLILLYGFSLYLAKVVTMARRGSEAVDIPAVARARWNVLAGAAAVGGIAAYGALTGGAIEEFNALLAWAGSDARLPTLAAMELPAETAAVLLSVVVAVLAIAVALMALVYIELSSQGTVTARGQDERASEQGGPEAIDLGPLDAEGVKAAPPQAFTEMAEEEALRLAYDAKEDGDVEKARLILDRYDELSEDEDEASETEDGADSGTDDETSESDAPDRASGDAPMAEDVATGGSEDRDVVSETASGMADAFTSEDTDEDDIGGYYYDLRFILESLTSKMFRIVAVFMIVLGSVFYALYAGGLGYVKDQFLDRIPEAVQAEAEIGVIALHPVEVLLFAVKMSVIMAVASVLPMILYYAWPSMKERGLAAGDRDIVLPWSAVLLIGFIIGTLLGFFYIAPAIISYLVYDAVDAGMIISFRLNKFFWLIFMTTVGIGLLANVPMSMFMFVHSKLTTTETLYGRWREFAIAVFVLSALLTPGSVLSMLLVAFPIVIAYWIGLAILWSAGFVRRGKPPFSPSLGAS